MTSKHVQKDDTKVRSKKMDNLVSHIFATYDFKNDDKNKVHHNGTVFEIEWLTLCNYWLCIRPNSKIGISVIGYDNYCVCHIYGWRTKLKPLNTNKKSDKQDWSILFRALKKFYNQANVKLKPNQDLIDPKLFDRAKANAPKSKFLNARLRMLIVHMKDNFIYFKVYGLSVIKLSRRMKKLAREPQDWDVKRTMNYLHHPQQTYKKLMSSGDLMYLSKSGHMEPKRQLVDFIDIACALWYCFNSSKIRKRIRHACLNDEEYLAVRGLALSYFVHKTNLRGNDLNAISAKLDDYLVWGDDTYANMAICNGYDILPDEEYNFTLENYADAIQQFSRPKRAKWLRKTLIYGYDAVTKPW